MPIYKSTSKYFECLKLDVDPELHHLTSGLSVAGVVVLVLDLLRMGVVPPPPPAPLLGGPSRVGEKVTLASCPPGVVVEEDADAHRSVGAASRPSPAPPPLLHPGPPATGPALIGENATFSNCLCKAGCAKLQPCVGY